MMERLQEFQLESKIVNLSVLNFLACKVVELTAIDK